MISIYDSSFKILKTILKEKEFFTISLKKCSDSIKKDEIVSVSSLCGLFLRNYYFIEAISSSIFDTKDIEPLIYIGLVYVNNSFKKIVDPNKSLSYLETKLALYQIKFLDERKASFEKAVTERREYLKEVFDLSNPKKVMFKYLSARNNMPEWIVKTIIKQYDRETSRKIINAMTKMPKQYGVINSLLVKEPTDDFKKDFKTIDGDLMEYELTSSIRKNQHVRVGEILPLQNAEYDLYKTLPDLTGGNVSFYFEEKEALYSLVCKKYLANNKVSLLSPNAKSNNELFSKIKSSKPENLDLYNSDIGGVITHLSEKQDVFIYMPKSSNFELLRRTPEFEILFDTSSLDSIIAKEREGLDEITKHVNDGGYLIYAVSTLNVKETLLLSKLFIEKYPEYSIERERIYFPHEKENSVFYFVIFKKIK